MLSLIIELSQVSCDIGWLTQGVVAWEFISRSKEAAGNVQTVGYNMELFTWLTIAHV